MSIARPVWGIHMEWDLSPDQEAPKDLAIGWPALGNLSTLDATRDAFKARFASAYPDDKPAATPVKAGILFRFAKEMQIGDVVVYPSKEDRIVYIGVISGGYSYLPNIDKDLSKSSKRRVESSDTAR